MNHETQRLLFAAGRGALIQTLWERGEDWMTASSIALHPHRQHRIHPLDVHLQYGPVSTELRRRADDDQRFELLTPYAWMADTWVYYCAGTGTITYGKNGNYPWLCAFAAELAADEGM